MTPVIKVLNYRDVVPESTLGAPIQILIHIKHVQKSGANVYFRPQFRDFVTSAQPNPKSFATFEEAYRYENW